ncbi:hypothetical protein AYI70_g7685 [Smittium culicis]|uniref:Uncharacterized protein n=1 Tax=Smittium culicis TaxID=133412 RepID=A0A1R1XJK9_9FUNG|nr:hypothetical protein AYI70_g7685 [Smittium culicis]
MGPRYRSKRTIHLQHPEDPSGEDHSISNHAVLVISPVVSRPKESINCITNQDPSFSSHLRSKKNKISDISQQ